MISVSEHLSQQLAVDIERKAKKAQQSEQARQKEDTQQRVMEQVMRAAGLSKSKTMSRYQNEDAITRSTGWTPIAFDPDANTSVQAQLSGMFKPGLFITTKPANLINVQLYLRPATFDGLAHSSSYDYAALFLPDGSPSVDEPGIYVPSGGNLPGSRKPVLPETADWRRIDMILGEISLRDGLEE
jgi:hypothetical protein